MARLVFYITKEFKWTRFLWFLVLFFTKIDFFSNMFSYSHFLNIFFQIKLVSLISFSDDVFWIFDIVRLIYIDY